jgi:endonuclease/exonuclease/phosphatase family metal-dependent hydrolase
LGEQAEKIAGIQADVVCLQEISPRNAARWTELLSTAGLEHEIVALPPRGAVRPRPLSVLTAARRELRELPIANIPWAERALATHTGELEIVNLHSPVSPSPQMAKVLTHGAVYAHLVRGSGPRLVCGDLNTPRREHPDGTAWTFARTRSGKLRPDRGEQWDRAELALIRGMEPFGFRDAFRELHGYEHREPSWEWPRTGGGYRLDHLIVSAEIEVHEVSYLHEWRKEGLSDHSPLLAELSVRR